MLIGGLGLGYHGGDIEAWKASVRELDEIGIGFIGMGDSFISTAVGAGETSRALIGTSVTNPITRHPTVMARDIAMIDHLSGGRAVLGIGRGFGHAHSIGRKPATTTELRDYIVAVRSLLRGRPTTWQGKDIGSTRLPRESSTPASDRVVPVLLSAYGPRTLELAGEVADGVMIASAANPELVEEAIGRVRSGAESVGRDPDEVQVWLFVRGAVADTREQALGRMKGLLAASIQQVPDASLRASSDISARLEKLRANYRFDQHAVWNGANAQLLDELGLTEFAADRLAVIGTPADCRARLVEFDRLRVNCVCVPASQQVGDDTMRRLVTEVWPAAC
jgi:5,10-methylenetetrahydromethanopterin reductase